MEQEYVTGLATRTEYMANTCMRLHIHVSIHKVITMNGIQRGTGAEPWSGGGALKLKDLNRLHA